MLSHRWSARPGAVALAGLLSLGALAGCGGSSSDGSTTTSTSTAADRTSTTGRAATTDGPSTTSGGASTTTTAVGLPGASTAPHSAPAKGDGQALLKAVRIGRNEGFDRIVFEFAGDTIPGYDVRWVAPPITADGSGETVQVAGDAFLQMVMQPASGVDLSGTDYQVVYDGPDRIDASGQAQAIEELVRTGDFEAVLTWVAGTKAEAPVRVLTLSSPSRVVVDIET